MTFEVYDIEDFPEFFLYVGYNVTTKKYVEFHMSEYRDDTYALAKHLEDKHIDYQVSFNGLNYDAQILQYFIDNYEKWVNFSSVEKCRKLKLFSNDVIERGKYDLRMPYQNFTNKQIDLFRIHHFDNENKRTSLKWIEFAIDFENVEESPVSFTTTKLTLDDISVIVKYCYNDVSATRELYYLTRGETDNKLYKNNDMIQNRFDIISEMGFPEWAVNWSDVGIGDQINLKLYKDLSRRNEQEIYKLKLNRKVKRGFTFGDCIPSYVSFSTPEFRMFHEMIKKEKVKLGHDIEAKKNAKKGFPFTYNGTTYTIAQGGIHSNEKNRIIKPTDRETCRDADIGSQYPNGIIKRMLFPSHLGQKWLNGYTWIRDKRMDFKATSKKKDISKAEKSKYEGLAEMFKLALNGGGFGKLNEQYNWQYDPFCAFSCTIGNQFEILMLIEMLELNKIHVISANTDGIVCLFDNSLSDTYYKICAEWEVKVGNDKIGKLEYTDYSLMIQSSVNDYIAVKKDEPDETKRVKKKGDFSTDYLINKNKSRLIIPLALENYFLKNIPVEETIMRDRNIFHFCIGAKASKDFHYETYGRDNSKEVYHRMIRYYVAKDGKKLMKIKNPDSESPGNDVTSCEAGGWLCKIVNLIDVGDDIRSYNINYKYYIDKALERIKLIHGAKKKDPLPNKNQISMF
jgi:hypothetical protein